MSDPRRFSSSAAALGAPEDIVALLRQIVRHELEGRPGPMIGVVEEIAPHSAEEDTENYGCDLRIRGRDLVLRGVPMATPFVGSVAAPAKGDLVIVDFVGPGEGQPVVIGRLYSEQTRPPLYDLRQLKLSTPVGGANEDRVDISLIAGESGKRAVSLQLPGDIAINVSDQCVEGRMGDLAFTMDIEEGTIRLDTGKASAMLNVEGAIQVSGEGDLALEASGDISFKAGGKVSVEGGSVEIKGREIQIG